MQNADYPGVVPYALSKNLFNRKLSDDERSVRGNVVVGLSDKDVEFLDLFEGDVSLSLVSTSFMIMS